MLTPKRLKCLTCGNFSKSGNARPTADRSREQVPSRSNAAIEADLAEWERLRRSGILTDAEYTAGRNNLLQGGTASRPRRTSEQDVVLEAVGADRTAAAQLVVRLDPTLSHAQARALVDAVTGGSVLIARRIDVETAVAAIGDFRACGSVIELKNCF